MRWRDLLFRRPGETGDWCGLPPRGSVRPHEKIAVKDGEACTACGHRLEPAAGLAEHVRIEGAAWWCARCGMQYREGEG